MHRKKKQTTIKMNINQASNTFLLIFFHKNLSCVAPFLDLAPAWILRPSMATPTSSTPKPSRNSRRPTQTRTTLASSRGQSISSLSAVYQQLSAMVGLRLCCFHMFSCQALGAQLKCSKAPWFPHHHLLLVLWWPHTLHVATCFVAK